MNETKAFFDKKCKKCGKELDYYREGYYVVYGKYIVSVGVNGVVKEKEKIEAGYVEGVRYGANKCKECKDYYCQKCSSV